MRLKTIVTFLYLCVSLLAFVSFNTNVSVWISFFLSFSVITIIAYYHLNIERVFSPFLGSYVIFNYLFFFIAPVFQISSLSLATPRFPNDFIFNTSTVITANILIIIFNITFFLSYIYFKKKRLVNSLLLDEKLVFYKHSTIAILVILLLCTLVVCFNYEYVITNIFESIYITNAKSESVSSLLLRKKFLFFLPLAGVVASISYLKEKNKLSTNTIVIFICLLVFIVMLLFLKNIFTEKRNTLGPIYIALIYLFYPKLLDSNSKFFLFLFLSMVIMFPLMSSLTHIDANLDQIVENPELLYESFLRFGTISGAFESLHYDAFSNILATLEYVEINGIALGYQLLGVILFFIPRSIWASKPTSTGELIGEYLMNTTPRDYSNLSNAIVSEGYINLGVFGVILLAIILAYFIVKFISWMISKNYFKEFIAFYFALHLLFLLRGDLTNGVSYFIGPLLSIYFVPKFLIRLFR